MKYFQAISLLAALSCTTSAAWAQYGLYGSPGLVDLPTVEGRAYAPQDATVQPSLPYRVAPAPHVASAWDAQPIPGATSPFPQMTDPAYSAYGHPTVPLTTVAAKKKRPPKKEQAPQKSSVVDEMLSESGGGFPEPWGPESDCGLEPDCGDCCDSCVPCFQPKWYASMRGLIMERGDRPNKVWTTYEFTDASNQLRHTWYPLEWEGGFDLRLGRRFCCGCNQWALEAGYWTLNPAEISVFRSHMNLVSTPLDLLNVEDPVVGGPAQGLFDEAEAHIIDRRNEVHSIELNLIRSPIGVVCGTPFHCSWTFGARFFRFEEDLVFSSLDEGGTVFGVDPTGYLDDKCVNNLIGAQLGCRVDYTRNKWRLYAFPKVGIYNNHIRHRFSGYRRDSVNGTVLFNVLWPGYPQYPVESTTDVVAFLTEFDVGLDWQFHPNWSATLGYRATVATGMALADHQIPFFPGDTPELADIDYNGYLLLHGAFAGVTCQF